MQRQLVGFTAYLLIALLVACGGGDENDASSTSNTSASGTSTSGTSTSTPSTSGPSTSKSNTPPAGTDVTTYKNDLSRTGQNVTETKLTTANVNSASFGLLRTLPVDGKVDAQPLYLSQLNISGTAHNVVYVATEHDSVYAFDADTGNALWHVDALGPGETLSDTRGCQQLVPEIGITATPVIDRNAGPHGAIYVVAMSKDASSNYHQRLHALDVTTGAELFNGPTEISGTYASTSGNGGGATNTFEPGQYAERAALLLSQGVIYTSWTSHCDEAPYSGWILGFNENTLAAASTLNVAPNSGAGPSIWMSGGGPAADSAGNIYLLTANGAFETTLDTNGFPNQQDFGNSFLKISPTNGSTRVVDYFTMSNEAAESAADQDLGSGGALLLPDMTDSANVVRHLMVGAGKDGNIYVVERGAMGKFSPTGNNIWQQINGAVPSGIWSTPAYYNSTVYYADAGSTLKAFTITNARLSATPASQSAAHFAYPGSAAAVSANGVSNGIVWAHENGNPAVLHAFDAGNLANELYNSNQAANNRDHFGSGNKFITPTIADGKVFVGTTSSVAVFGLLH